jgi:hypothetical protein
MTASNTNYPLKSSIQKSPKTGASKKRRVAFATVHQPAHVNCQYEYDAARVSGPYNDDEEKHQSWYSNEELIRMKEESRCNARLLRVTVEKNRAVMDDMNNSQSTMFPLFNEKAQAKMIATYRKLDDMKCAEAGLELISHDLEPRGLEHRIFLERQINKYFTDKAILECQRRTKESVARAASKGGHNLKLLIEAAEIRLSTVSEKLTAWSRNLAVATGKSDFESVYDKSCIESNNMIDKNLQRSSLKRNCLDESRLSHFVEIGSESNKRQKTNNFVDLTIANSAPQLVGKSLITAPRSHIIGIKS